MNVDKDMSFIRYTHTVIHTLLKPRSVWKEKGQAVLQFIGTPYLLLQFPRWHYNMQQRAHVEEMKFDMNVEWITLHIHSYWKI